MQGVQYYHAIYAHCEGAAYYYAEKYEQPRAREEAIYEPEDDGGDE